MFTDPSKDSRGGFSPSASRNPLRVLSVADPRLRILILLVTLGILVAIAVGLNRWAQSKPVKSPDIAEVPSEELGRTGEKPFFPGVPGFDQELADRISDRGPEARKRWPNEAVSYLLAETTIPAVYSYNRNLWPITPESAEQIGGTGEGQGSRPWRFKFVRFRGRLEYLVEQEDYQAVYGGEDDIGRVHRGRTILEVDGKIARVTFLTRDLLTWSDPNEESSDVREITDGWVRGRGILIKNFTDDLPSGEAVPSLLLVATRVDRDFEAREVTSLDECDFGIIRDDPALSSDPEAARILGKLYPRPLFRLMQYAGRRAGPEGAASRAKDGLVPASFDSKEGYEALLGNPAAARGKYFGGKGVLVASPDVYDVTDTPANDAGIEDFLFGWILTDRQLLFQYAAPISLAPALDALGKRVHLRYEGFFFKSRAYPARNGTDRVAPLLVLTVLEPLPEPESDLSFQIFIAVGFILGASLLIFFIVREDRVKQDYRRHRTGKVVPIEDPE